MSLRRACLELRFCIEALCYDVLPTYEAELPLEVVGKWQPRKIVQALLDVDPDSDKDYEMRFAEENPDGSPGEWITVGVRRGLKLEVVNTIYQRLGGFLHLPTLRQIRDGRAPTAESIRPILERSIPVLEDLAESSFKSNVADFVTFPCEFCGTLFKRRKTLLVPGDQIECRNRDCSAVYVCLEIPDASSIARFKAFEHGYDCRCGARNYVVPRGEGEQVRFKCHECGRETVWMRRWAYIELDPGVDLNEVDLNEVDLNEKEMHIAEPTPDTEPRSS